MKEAPLFTKVLVANRGEIACRVIRTLRRLGIASVAVYSDADGGARHVREADEAVRIGPAAAPESYLNIAAIVEACRATGAEAVHPGYGFLSENEAFARALGEAGITFVGPGVEALAVMGDKIRAKNHVAGFGVPVVPGFARPGLTDAELVEAADGVGYPLLIKPSAGGGGKGMHVVESADELPRGLATARRVAAAAFGDDTLFVERLIRAPRHIEVQVLADQHGNTIHLGERECSLQRRHQKVIEEAPSPLFDTALGAQTRAKIGQAACDAARSVGYTGAGTVEFLVSDEAPDEFFFMEMNTRLQVEHPVTEMVTGVDLVEQQLRIAAGEPLGLVQDDLHLDGHAIEARVYSEALVETGAGRREFLPATGTIEFLREPVGSGIRVDSSLLEGLNISADYDPMLAKTIAWGRDRNEALTRLDAALADYAVLGVATNIEYLRLLLEDPDVQAGKLDTTLIERRLEHLEFRAPEEAEMVAAALLAEHTRERHDGAGAWRLDGWRSGAAAARRVTLGTPDGGVVTVRVSAPQGDRGTPPDLWRVAVEAGSERKVSFAVVGHSVQLELDGEPHAYSWAVGRAGEGQRIFLGDGGWSIAFPVLGRAERLERVLAAIHRNEGEASPEVRSPMPGTVVSVAVAPGQSVEPGQPLVSVEAMKMEHQLVAGVAGTVQLHVGIGALVKADQVVATVTPASTHAAPEPSPQS